MATYSDLVDVKFVDNTTYANTTDGDVLGAYLNWYWGPSDKVVTCQQRDFYHLFPESKPATFEDKVADKVTSYSVSFSDTDSYIQLKRFFESGGSTAEIYRDGTAVKYAALDLTTGAVSAVSSIDGVNTIYAKYRGVPSSDMMGDCTAVGVKFSGTVDSITIQVIGWSSDTNRVSGAAPTEFKVLEEFKYVSLVPGTVLDGKSVYINDVLADSDWLQGSASSIDYTVTETQFNALTKVVNFLFSPLFTSGSLSIPALTKTQISNAVAAFEDVETTTATWLLGSEFAAVAAERKTSIAIQSLPVSVTLTKANVIKEYASAVKSQFAVFIAGREVVVFWGKKVASSCAGAWCGCQCSTANQVRINQVASAKTYGAFSGALQSTLTFNEVLELHDLGIISVYSTTTGPYIFGVHTTFTRQTSYFGKLNVMRVVTRLLRDVLPSFFGAIHTDTAANPITRRSFGIAIQSIVDEYIANQNLRSQSIIDVSENVNNDYTTKSGTVLNAVFELWFIGLVEKVKITIQATDSTVSTDIE